MKIFLCTQIREIDQITVRDEPVSPAGLMERAASVLFNWIASRFERPVRILIFTGPGNNGGDGLALARMLAGDRFNVLVYHVDVSANTSEEWQRNRIRLQNETSVPFNIIKREVDFPVITKDDLCIDAIFGSGLSRPAEGLAATIIRYINNRAPEVVSIDIPSGLFGEDNSNNNYENIIKATYTLSFQFPKLSFLFPENHPYTGEWVVLPIGLSDKAIRETPTPFKLAEIEDIRLLLRKRQKFDHKGTYGHGLLVAGSFEKMGAAVLGAKAALRSGIGLVTCHVPALCVQVIQTTIPEAMVKPDINEKYLTGIPEHAGYDAIAIGPGTGMENDSMAAVKTLLGNTHKPMVIDADAINILGLNREWLSLIPAGSILTPHIKEFERIAGKTANSFERLMKQINFSEEHKCIIVLKGAYTSVSSPDGSVFFNSTGNPGMATAGSGDVLTGIILSLMAGGYEPEKAAKAAVFIHGLAGDIAAGEKGYESLIASDIIESIGSAFKRITCR